MAIQERLTSLDTRNLTKVAQKPCVYELANELGETFKFGMSKTSCRRRLGEQLGSAHQFRWQESRNPECEEASLIQEYQRNFGLMPPGNLQRPRPQNCNLPSQTATWLPVIGALLLGAALIGGLLWAGHQAARRRQYQPRISSGVRRVTERGIALISR